MLSRDQLTTFEQDGFLVVRQRLDDDVLQPVRRVIAHFVDEKIRAYHAAGQIQNPHMEAPFEKRWAIVCRENGLQTGTEAIVNWGRRDLLDPAVYDLYTFGPLTDVVASLLGPELKANGDYWVRPKIPADPSTTVAWHQDSFYFGGSTAPKFRVLTVWVPLVDVDEQNGCLRVVRGSHRHGAIAWRKNKQGQREPIEDVTRYGTPVGVPMLVGDVLIFNNLTLHASGDNTTDQVRWSIELRYMPADQSFAWHDLGDAFDVQFPGFVARSAAPKRVTSWPQWRDRWTAIR